MQAKTVAWSVASVAVIAAMAVTAGAQQQDAPRWERRDRGAAGGAERRGPAQERRAGVGGEAMQRGAMGGGVGRETMLAYFVNNPKTAERLGLNSNQVSALSEKLDAIQKEKVQVRAELEIAGMEQAKLLMAESIDEAALTAAVEKTGAVHTRLAKLEIQPIIELKKVLTPAQIAMAKEMVRERLRERAGADGQAPRGEGRWRGDAAPDGGPGPMAPPTPPPAPEGEPM